MKIEPSFRKPAYVMTTVLHPRQRGSRCRRSRPCSTRRSPSSASTRCRSSDSTQTSRSPGCSALPETTVRVEVARRTTRDRQQNHQDAFHDEDSRALFDANHRELNGRRKRLSSARHGQKRILIVRDGESEERDAISGHEGRRCVLSASRRVSSGNANDVPPFVNALRRFQLGC